MLRCFIEEYIIETNLFDLSLSSVEQWSKKLPFLSILTPKYLAVLLGLSEVLSQTVVGKSDFLFVIMNEVFLKVVLVAFIRFLISSWSSLSKSLLISLSLAFASFANRIILLLLTETVKSLKQ